MVRLTDRPDMTLKGRMQLQSGEKVCREIKIPKNKYKHNLRLFIDSDSWDNISR